LSTGMPLPASARLSAMPAEAEGEWWHLFGLMRGLGRLDAEVAEAARAYEQDQTELNLRRLTGLAAARLELVQIEDDA